MQNASRDLFEAKVDRSGGPDACHLWTGARTEYGYGQFRFNGYVTTASRVAWILAHGEPPPETPLVLHNCPTGDNPRCVNVRHLWVGTQSDNMKDCVSKGRQVCNLRFGAEHNNSKLAAVADDIRRRFAAGESKRSLAIAYGVQRTSIYLIVTGRTYKPTTSPLR